MPPFTKTKLIIAGIGGVGGYFGGLLAKHYSNSESVEVNFVARGQHLAEIQEKGLTVIKGETPFVARPKMATDQPSEIGKADIILICTKSYDLENVLQQLEPCIHEGTILLPLLNGIEGKERIEQYFPNNLVLDGCVYIVSRLKQAGVIENSGNIQTLYFGNNQAKIDKLVELEQLFKAANIEANYVQNSAQIIWEKFIFLSPIASVTSYYDKSVGEIISNDESFATAKSLIEEVVRLANAKNNSFSDDIVEKTIAKFQSLPYETTSSMHNDFKNGKSTTELSSLTAYVISECENYGLPSPTYSKLYAELALKSGVMNL